MITELLSKKYVEAVTSYTWRCLKEIRLQAIGLAYLNNGGLDSVYFTKNNSGFPINKTSNLIWTASIDDIINFSINSAGVARLYYQIL